MILPPLLPTIKELVRLLFLGIPTHFWRQNHMEFTYEKNELLKKMGFFILYPRFEKKITIEMGFCFPFYVLL